MFELLAVVSVLFFWRGDRIIYALTGLVRVVFESITDYIDKRRQHEFRTQALKSNKRIVEMLPGGNFKAVENDGAPAPKRKRKNDDDG